MWKSSERSEVWTVNQNIYRWRRGEKEMDLGKCGGISVCDPDRLDVGDEGERAIKDDTQVWGSSSWVYSGLIY